MDLSSIRLFIFSSILLTMIILEKFFPYKTLLRPKMIRWRINFSFTLINAFLVYSLSTISLISIANMCSQNDWGLLNLVTIPFLIKFIISILLLDFFIYLQHLLSHRIDFFWRFHQTHHQDGDLDVTTAIRFHPIEILASYFYKALLIFVFGIPGKSVLLFEIILNSMAMFNHANIKIPSKLESFLRYFIVTPNVHRIHHSIEKTHQRKNFGFNLIIWDRLFGTFLIKTQVPLEKIKVGITNFPVEDEPHFLRTFFHPFKR